MSRVADHVSQTRRDEAKAEQAVLQQRLRNGTLLDDEPPGEGEGHPQGQPSALLSSMVSAIKEEEEAAQHRADEAEARRLSTVGNINDLSPGQRSQLSARNIADRALDKLQLMSQLLQLDRGDPGLKDVKHMQLPAPITSLRDELERRRLPLDIRPGEFFSSYLTNITSILDEPEEDGLATEDAIDAEEFAVLKDLAAALRVKKLRLATCHCRQRLDEVVSEAEAYQRTATRAECTRSFAKAVGGAVGMVRLMEQVMLDREENCGWAHDQPDMSLQLSTIRGQCAVLEGNVADLARWEGSNSAELVDGSPEARKAAKARAQQALLQRMGATAGSERRPSDNRSDSAVLRDQHMMAAAKAVQLAGQRDGVQARLECCEQACMAHHDLVSQANDAHQKKLDQHARDRRRLQHAPPTAASEVATMDMNMAHEAKVTGWTAKGVPADAQDAAQQLMAQIKTLVATVDHNRVMTVTDMIEGLDMRTRHKALSAVGTWQRDLKNVVKESVEALRAPLQALAKSLVDAHAGKKGASARRLSLPPPSPQARPPAAPSVTETAEHVALRSQFVEAEGSSMFDALMEEVGRVREVVAQCTAHELEPLTGTTTKERCYDGLAEARRVLASWEPPQPPVKSAGRKERPAGEKRPGRQSKVRDKDKEKEKEERKPPPHSAPPEPPVEDPFSHIAPLPPGRVVSPEAAVQPGVPPADSSPVQGRHASEEREGASPADAPLPTAVVTSMSLSSTGLTSPKAKKHGSGQPLPGFISINREESGVLSPTLASPSALSPHEDDDGQQPKGRKKPHKDKEREKDVAVLGAATVDLGGACKLLFDAAEESLGVRIEEKLQREVRANTFIAKKAPVDINAGAVDSIAKAIRALAHGVNACCSVEVVEGEDAAAAVAARRAVPVTDQSTPPSLAVSLRASPHERKVVGAGEGTRAEAASPPPAGHRGPIVVVKRPAVGPKPKLQTVIGSEGQILGVEQARVETADVDVQTLPQAGLAGIHVPTSLLEHIGDGRSMSAASLLSEQGVQAGFMLPTSAARTLSASLAPASASVPLPRSMQTQATQDASSRRASPRSGSPRSSPKNRGRNKPKPTGDRDDKREPATAKKLSHSDAVSATDGGMTFVTVNEAGQVVLPTRPSPEESPFGGDWASVWANPQGTQQPTAACADAEVQTRPVPGLPPLGLPSGRSSVSSEEPVNLPSDQRVAAVIANTKARVERDKAAKALGRPRKASSAGLPHRHGFGPKAQAVATHDTLQQEVDNAAPLYPGAIPALGGKAGLTREQLLQKREQMGGTLFKDTPALARSHTPPPAPMSTMDKLNQFLGPAKVETPTTPSRWRQGEREVEKRLQGLNRRQGAEESAVLVQAAKEAMEGMAETERVEPGLDAPQQRDRAGGMLSRGGVPGAKAETLRSISVLRSKLLALFSSLAEVAMKKQVVAPLPVHFVTSMQQRLIPIKPTDGLASLTEALKQLAEMTEAVSEGAVRNATDVLPPKDSRVVVSPALEQENREMCGASLALCKLIIRDLGLEGAVPDVTRVSLRRPSNWAAPSQRETLGFVSDVKDLLEKRAIQRLSAATKAGLGPAVDTGSVSSVPASAAVTGVPSLAGTLRDHDAFCLSTENTARGSGRASVLSHDTRQGGRGEQAVPNAYAAHSPLLSHRQSHASGKASEHAVLQAELEKMTELAKANEREAARAVAAMHRMRQRDLTSGGNGTSTPQVSTAPGTAAGPGTAPTAAGTSAPSAPIGDGEPADPLEATDDVDRDVARFLAHSPPPRDMFDMTGGAAAPVMVTPTVDEFIAGLSKVDAVAVGYKLLGPQMVALHRSLFAAVVAVYRRLRLPGGQLLDDPFAGLTGEPDVAAVPDVADIMGIDRDICDALHSVLAGDTKAAMAKMRTTFERVRMERARRRVQDLKEERQRLRETSPYWKKVYAFLDRQEARYARQVVSIDERRREIREQQQKHWLEASAALSHTMQVQPLRLHTIAVGSPQGPQAKWTGAGQTIRAATELLPVELQPLQDSPYMALFISRLDGWMAAKQRMGRPAHQAGSPRRPPIEALQQAPPGTRGITVPAPTKASTPPPTRSAVTVMTEMQRRWSQRRARVTGMPSLKAPPTPAVAGLDRSASPKPPLISPGAALPRSPGRGQPSLPALALTTGTRREPAHPSRQGRSTKASTPASLVALAQTAMKQHLDKTDTKLTQPLPRIGP